MSKTTSIALVIGIFIGFALGGRTCQQEIDQVIYELSGANDSLEYANNQISMLNNQLK